MKQKNEWVFGLIRAICVWVLAFWILAVVDPEHEKFWKGAIPEAWEKGIFLLLIIFIPLVVIAAVNAHTYLERRREEEESYIDRVRTRDFFPAKENTDQ